MVSYDTAQTAVHAVPRRQLFDSTCTERNVFLEHERFLCWQLKILRAPMICLLSSTGATVSICRANDNKSCHWSLLITCFHAQSQRQKDNGAKCQCIVDTSSQPDSVRVTRSQYHLAVTQSTNTPLSSPYTTCLFHHSHPSPGSPVCYCPKILVLGRDPKQFFLDDFL